MLPKMGSCVRERTRVSLVKKKKKARQTLEGFPPLASVARLGPEFPLNLATLDAGGRAAVQPGLPDRAGYLTQSGNTVPCST